MSYPNNESMMYRLKGLIYGVISSATFGLIPLFALPAIRNGIGVDSVMFYRFGISALVLGLWLVIRRYDLRISDGNCSLWPDWVFFML